VRLAECNLQCPFCDTIYTDGIGDVDTEDLGYEIVIKTRGDKDTVVVITGGEPLRQNLVPLAEFLGRHGLQVQVETNGSTVWDEQGFLELVAMDHVLIVCSPKTRRIHPIVGLHADAFKYVVTAGDVDKDGLPIHALGLRHVEGFAVAKPPEDFEGPIYIQPMDEKDDTKNEENMNEAVRSVLNHNGWRILNLQIHKYAGLE
jgi:organic radical activating enzyme